MLVLAACAGGLLCSCAASSPQVRVAGIDVEAPRTASAAQRAALADGTVTYEEYEQAWRRLAACEARYGYTIYKGYELNKVIAGAIPGAAVDSGVDARCSAKEWEAVSTAWQLGRENTGPANLAYRACLREAGIEPKTAVKANVALLQRAGIDRDRCEARQPPKITPTLGPTS